MIVCKGLIMNKTPQSVIISNRKFIDNDTSEIVDKYIDTLCEDPKFLCENREMCGNNTSIYTNKANVDSICENIVKANQCENNVDECIVLADNSIDDSQKYVSTSFVNIIVPIPNVIDSDGNQKFLRLPPLSGSKKKNSNEICHVCACMDRFARSPGSSVNDYTSPGQNECVYPSDFEYYYYPLYIESIRSKLKDAPPVIVGKKKYRVLNKNIIYANTQEDLNIGNLYQLLLNKGIQERDVRNFVLNILYKNDQEKAKELEQFLINKGLINQLNLSKNKLFSNMSFFYIIFIIFLVMVFIYYRLNK